MALLTEENNQTHQVVQLNLESKQTSILFYGSKGECEQYLETIPGAGDLDHFVTAIDTSDPRTSGG